MHGNRILSNSHKRVFFHVRNEKYPFVSKLFGYTNLHLLRKINKKPIKYKKLA